MGCCRLRSGIICAMMLAISPPALASEPPGKAQDEPADIRRTLIIMHSLTSPQDKAKLLKAAHQLQARVLYDLQQVNALVVRLPEGQSIEQAITHLKAMDGVLSVERDSIMHLQ